MRTGSAVAPKLGDWHLLCLDQSGSFPIYYLCDGVYDCWDGSDENEGCRDLEEWTLKKSLENSRTPARHL
jgi:hypothetical protein